MRDEVDLFGYVYPGNSACLVCTHVSEGEALAFVACDEDGDLAFACERQGHEDSEWKVVALRRAALMIDVASLPPLEEGQQARRSASGEWQVEPTR